MSSTKFYLAIARNSRISKRKKFRIENGFVRIGQRQRSETYMFGWLTDQKPATHEPVSFLRRELPTPALLAARCVAVGLALILLVMYLRWVPSWFAMRASEAATFGTGNALYDAASRIAIAAALLSAVAWFVLAALIFAKRSRDLYGIVLALTFLSLGVMLTDLPVIIYMAREDSWAPLPAIVFLIANSFCVPWGYFFPDGRFVPRSTIILTIVWVGWNILRMVTPAADQTRIGLPAILLNSAFHVSMVGAFAHRYRTTANPVLRQQIKWLVLGSLITVVALTVALPPRYLFAEFAEGGPRFMLRTATAFFLALASTTLPLLIAAAIFRQGLFNISLLINRTVTYLALTVILATLFLALGLIVKRVLQATIDLNSELALLMVTVPTALAFFPVRAWLLSIADRFVSDRTVRTLVFIDIVDSTARAVALGDQHWRQVLEQFRALVRRTLTRLGGQEIDSAGDGFFVAFEGPDRAIQWARKIVQEVRSLGLELRAGAHVGEVEVHGQHVTGVAVHVAARLTAAAAPGEIVLSQALGELIAGSEIRVADRGFHSLKGLPGEWRLFAVA